MIQHSNVIIKIRNYQSQNFKKSLENASDRKTINMKQI
jgi:hypothetical protein